MNNKPIISIIVPVYKTEAYLEQCIVSILNQTFEDFELILVNDGSPDNCGAICNSFAKGDNRIRVIHKENGGLASAITAGCKIAQGSYFGFVDSDDWIEHQMFAEMYSCALEQEADIVTCGYIHVDGSKQSFDKEGIANVLVPELLNIFGYRRYIFDNGRCNKLFRAQLIKGNLDFYDPKVRDGEDLVLTFSALLDANKVVCLGNAYFYHYRMNPNSMTLSYNPNFWNNTKLLITTLLTIADAKGCLSEKLSLVAPTFVYAAIRYELNSGIVLSEQYRKIKRILKDNNGLRRIPLLRQKARKVSDKLSLFLLEYKQIAVLIFFNKLQKMRTHILYRARGERIISRYKVEKSL